MPAKKNSNICLDENAVRQKVCQAINACNSLAKVVKEGSTVKKYSFISRIGVATEKDKFIIKLYFNENFADNEGNRQYVLRNLRKTLKQNNVHNIDLSFVSDIKHEVAHEKINGFFDLVTSSISLSLIQVTIILQEKANPKSLQPRFLNAMVTDLIHLGSKLIRKDATNLQSIPRKAHLLYLSELLPIDENLVRRYLSIESQGLKLLNKIDQIIGGGFLLNYRIIDLDAMRINDILDLDVMKIKINLFQIDNFSLIKILSSQTLLKKWLSLFESSKSAYNDYCKSMSDFDTIYQWVVCIVNYWTEHEVKEIFGNCFLESARILINTTYPDKSKKFSFTCKFNEAFKLNFPPC